MVRSTLGMLLCTGILFGQAGTAPSFDVVAIKGGREPLEGFNRGESVQAKPGNLTMHSVRLVTAVAWAYSAQEWQVNGPSWIFQERYDILAKSEAPAEDGQLRTMLQALLADRFKVVLHRQTKEVEGITLSVGKSGHKLQEAKGPVPGSVKMTKMGATSEGGTMAELMAIGTRELRMPVIDQTGLTGYYDFVLDLSPYITPESSRENDMLNVAATAFQAQLGLKMEVKKKIPVEMVIVETAEKRPAEN